jgi:hypothetical protein
MVHLLPRTWRDVGKRGQILLAVGFLWVLTGMGTLTGPEPPAWANVVMLRDYPVGVAWVATGLLAIAIALRPLRIEHDGAGFLGLYIMPAYYAAAYIIAWVDSLTPFVGSAGYARGWIASISYLAIVSVVLICANWADPPRMPPPCDHDGGGAP